MNYLRGAVSAISAPYQYYRDLNPSTLTGAIDVIVIRRPKQSPDGDEVHAESAEVAGGETELVCSPFHVRFGKWQVLRPADKKVDVFVNGNAIPFSMKIGDAGEAFFIFETDEDVPEDLVTSPLLAATNPEETNAQDKPSGRFGANPSSDNTPDGESQEPDFLDLDASGSGEPALPITSESDDPTNAAQEAGEHGSVNEADAFSKDEGPSLLSRTARIGKAVVGMASEVAKSERDKVKDKTIKEAAHEIEEEESSFLKDRFVAARNSASEYLPFGSQIGSQKGDEALPATEPVDAPDVRYTHDIVYDTEGYHAQSHARDRSEQTVTGADTPGPSTPRSRSPSASAQQTPEPSRTPSPEPTVSSPFTKTVPFPIRATSEPPPDMSDIQFPQSSPSRALKPSLNDPTASSSTLRLSIPQDTDEYSWEWGSFPQRTPTMTSFGKSNSSGSSVKGKQRMSSFAEDDEGEEAAYWTSQAEARAKSRLSQSPNEEDLAYGAGGRLTVDRRDPSRFRVFIEGRTVEFELSLISPTSDGRAFYGVDDVDSALRFEEGKLNFTQFLGNDQLLHDERLVIRWAREMYITQQDASPLIGALAVWREGALRSKSGLLSSRPVSPDASDRTRRASSVDVAGLPTLEDHPLAGQKTGDLEPPNKPSSSSWVRWWSRSRRETEATRPELRPISSEPMPASKGKSPAPVSRETSLDAPERRSRSADTVQLGESQLERRPRKRFAKTLRLTSEQLEKLDLKSGANTITFSLSSTGVVAATARLFVWDHTDSVVVSDIDGTITKSDALGHVFTMIGRDWTHLGVAKLYTDICRNGYKIMYLTSRAIGQADSTRDYLKGIKQNDYQLPEGPVIMSPDRLMASLHREVIMRKPEVFKMACLRDIQRLFGSSARNPFYAGFGNRITDALSYRSVNVPSSRIFTIDSTGEVKMELLELAGYKSSYIHMTDLVDQMFPPIHRKWAAEYTDFNYWKPPIQDFALPDLSPPSPALSARSDTSNQSTLARLRNFSLVGNRSSNNMSQFTLPPPATTEGEGFNPDQRRKEAHVRQMSSLERLSSTLASLTSSAAASPRSASPTFFDSENEEYEGDAEEGDLEKGHRGRRPRTRSMSSMPGSLPGSPSPGSDDEMEFGEEEGEGEEYEYEEEGAAEEAFDEDLLATGEMENIPFL